MDLLIFSSIQILSIGVIIFIFSAIIQLVFFRKNLFRFLIPIFLLGSIYCLFTNNISLFVLLFIFTFFSSLAIGFAKFIYYFKLATDKKIEHFNNEDKK
jgi:hypothetical protein